MRLSRTHILGTVALLLLFFVVAGAFSGSVAATDGDHIDIHEENKTNSSALTDTSAGSSEGLTEQTQGGIEVAITVVPTGESFTPDETIDIFVGAYNTTGAVKGVQGEDLTVTVERPDGTTETFDVTTDANGSAHVSYDLADSNRGTGSYSLTVDRVGGDQSATVHPTVGPVIEEMNNRDAPVFVDDESTFSFLVRSGEFGVEGEPVEIVIEDPSGNIISQENVTTDADGFVKTTLAPSQTGTYTIKANLAQHPSSIWQDVRVVEKSVSVPYDLGEGIEGEEAVFGGYVRDVNGQAANTDLVVRFINRTSWPGEYVVNKSVTTGENGFFLVKYQVPEDVDRMDARVETTDGTVLTEEYIDIEKASSSSGPSANVSFSANFDDYDYAPGDEATVNIEATEDGNPLANQEVTVFVRLDWSGAPIRTATVTTNQDGTASTTVAIPEGTDSADIDGTATMKYDGKHWTSSLWGDIQKYDIFFDAEDKQIGQDINFTVHAETPEGDPVEGIPQQFAGLYTDYRAGTYATGELVTGQDGTDTITVSVPDDLGPGTELNYVDRYTSTGTNRIYMFQYPGKLEIDASSETEWGDPVARPGEDISLNFTTADGTAVQGIAFTSIYYGDTWADASIGTTINDSSDSKLSIPDYAGDDSYVSVWVWATDSQGKFYSDRQSIEINASAVELAPLDISLSPSSVTANESTDVSVTVTDGDTGEAVSGATVEISELGLTATTNTTGVAVLPVNASIAGQYSVSASADGYEDTTTTLTVQPESTTVGVQPASQNTSIGGTATYEIAVDGYDAGIASYEFTASIGNTSTAKITDVSLKGTSPSDSLTSVNYTGDNASVSVAAGAAGHDNGVIATITVEGNNTGTTSITMSNVAVGDINGNAYTVDAVSNGTLSVVESPAVVGDSPVQDPDGDGTYEDLNGDGSFDIVDVNAMFQNYDGQDVQNNSSLFDFNDDGTVNIVDVNALFQQAVA